jgi:hypothetical protein
MKIRLNAARSAVVIRVLFGVTLLQIAASQSVAGHREDFDSFWHRFRAVALTKDWDALAAVTAFPLTTRGVLDRDPVYHVNRTEFKKVFRTFLAEWAIPGGNQLGFIRSITDVSQRKGTSTDTVRIGDMIFRRVKGKWRLDTLYMQYTS